MGAKFVALGTARNAGKLAYECAASCKREGFEYHLAAARCTDDTVYQAHAGGATRILVSDAHILENTCALVSSLDPDTVVIWLDGDDSLLPGAGARVRRAYDEDPSLLLTYGSFDWWIGGERSYHPYRCTETPAWVIRDNAFRKDYWRASHLRTFRAGLFQCIPRACLQWPDGRWIVSATDLAVMWPMLEMCGGRFRFIRESLMRYNYGAVPPDPRSIAEEDETCAYLRAMPPQPRKTDWGW